MVFRIVKDVRDINRFREILAVLFEEGFDFLIEKTNLKYKIPFTRRIKRSIEKKKSYSVEKRLRLTLERLGPTFIKFGQLLSVRPDLVPSSYIKELENLQDKIEQFSYETAKDIIRKELGKDVSQLFRQFDKNPIASASISQVHKAILKDGSKVAVKIQRPKVKGIMETDIEIMFHFAKLLENHFPNTKKYSPVRIIEEFAKWTEKELDFNKEAINAKRFAGNFAGSKTVKIPKIYDNFTTERVLVMEFIEGIELHNINEARKRRINLRPLIKNGFEAVLTQVFVHGFFHGDPHPGNIIITNERKIAFVDFGIVGYFDENLKSKSIDLFYGLITNDTELVVETLVKLSNYEIENEEELKNDVGYVIGSIKGKDISKIRISHALEEILNLALGYGLKMPLSFVLFGKTVITLEGIALRYDPSFRIIESSRPFIEKLVRQRYNPVNSFSNFMKSMLKLRKFAEEIPEEASRALKKIEKGTIKVDIEDTDIKKLSLEIDKSSNRIAYSMLIAAFLIVAALMIKAGEPVLLSMSLISLLSFLAAMTLIFILMLSILKEARY